ncbi:neurogenic locus Notch protein, partial [Caerostris extrusa]
CDCENGKCRINKFEVICECLPEYGKYKDACKACDCGTGANCTFDVGFWSTDKYCLDPLQQQSQNGGTCKDEGKELKCACKSPYLGDLCERSND